MLHVEEEQQISKGVYHKRENTCLDHSLGKQIHW